MKIGIYTRVSTEEQKKTGISLRDQELRGIEFCIKNGYEYEVFSDGGYSGELYLEFRPSLNNFSKPNCPLLSVEILPKYPTTWLPHVL